MTHTPAANPSFQAFQFYPDWWLSDLQITAMSAAAEGCLIRLITRQWKAVTLPADPAVLQKLTKATEKEWRTIWPELAPMLPVVEEGAGRRNPQIHALYLERVAFIEAKRTAGKLGGRPTRKRKETTRESEGEASGNHDHQHEESTEKPHAFQMDKHSETPMSVSVSVSKPTPIRLTADSPPSADQPAIAIAEAFRPAYALLCATAMPHQRAALDFLLRSSPVPDVLLTSIHAIATGMHPCISEKGETAGIEHVLMALPEAVLKYFASGEKSFSAPLFFGCVRQVVNRKPEPSTADQRAGEAQLRHALPALRFDAAEPPDSERARDAALRKFWLDQGFPQKAAQYERAALQVA